MNRGMSVTELRAYRDALASKLGDLRRIAPTCETCLHFAQAPLCTKFGAVPPEDFRRTPEACDVWEFDGVPF